MRIPTQQEIDARARQLGQDINGTCPPRLRAGIAKQLAQESAAQSEAPPEALAEVAARFDRELASLGVPELVRAHAVGGLISSLALGNTEITPHS